MESVRGKYKPQAPCLCGAVDEKGNLVEHQRPTHKMCLRNPKRMRTAEPVIEEPIERFTIKVNIDSMFNCDTDFGQRFKDCMLEAIERYNHITFLASKLITLHAWASISWIANVQVDVCYHLSQRLERWIVLRLAADLAQQIPEKGLWRIASRIVENLMWKEKAAFGRARSLGLSDPISPVYVKPETLDDLLGENLINSLQQPLNEESRVILWRLFTDEILASIRSALPLCPSKFRETLAWQTYYPLHLKMLVDIEQLAGSPLSHAEPANRPSRGWLRRKVEKIALSERTTLSQTHKAKAMSWLLQMIVTQQTGHPRKSLHKLSPTLEKLEQKAQKTIEKMRSGSFCPKQFLRTSGANRAFSALPQFSFGTRYMAVDNRVLKELLATLWRRGYHPFPDGLPASARPVVVSPFSSASNTRGPGSGIPLPAGLPSRQTQRQFDFYMSTDGVGASFTCRRPRRTPGAAVTPTTVPFRLGSSTFVSIDPGLTDLAVGVRAELTWPRLRDGRVDMEAREPLRWKTYCREQKALHSICMRVKGNKSAKKEDVVVAYGDGRFGSTMVGKRAAPVKKLRKHLRRYVTVVSVDEYRTSRLCSKHNEQHIERTGLGEQADEGGGTSQRAPDLIHIHAQRDANGAKGPSLHSVLYCNKCHTV
ncbi:hypothetical protein V1520DRAFT_356600 [Lipomyces starkeyi]